MLDAPPQYATAEQKRVHRERSIARAGKEQSDEPIIAKSITHMNCKDVVGAVGLKREQVPFFSTPCREVELVRPHRQLRSAAQFIRYEWSNFDRELQAVDEIAKRERLLLQLLTPKLLLVEFRSRLVLFSAVGSAEFRCVMRLSFG